ncbi:hypothetical protein QUF70_21965 [Desulfobacterales bacterium HSG17]|nr:hypothetical protein [Desulfobacterales bacterium HSG17]
MEVSKADISREIDLFLEEIYDDSKKAGEEMAEVGLGKAQIRGLETMILSTTRFSEIMNYIKNQAGKDNKMKWAIVAPGLIKRLEKLEEKAEELGKNDPSLCLAIKMKLARGWEKQVISHCLYQLLLMGGR